MKDTTVDKVRGVLGKDGKDERARGQKYERIKRRKDERIDSDWKRMTGKDP